MIAHDCRIFAVPKGTGVKGVFSWHASTTEPKTPITFKGAGATDANMGFMLKVRDNSSGL